jgi:hypothetical protein
MSELEESLPVISLATSSGPIDVAVRIVAASSGAITAEFDMAAATHDQALREGWFHLGPITAGPGARSFGPDPDVRVQVRLDPRLVAGLRLVVDTPDGVAELVQAFDVSTPLRDEASWYACSATVELPIDDDDDDLRAALVDGSLREGYRTAWGSDPGLPGLPIAAHLAEVLERRFQGVEPLVEQPGFRWKLSGSSASWTSTAIVDSDEGWCVLYSEVDGAGGGIDRDELAGRANDLSSGLLFGSWHIVGEPPAVRFRSGLELGDSVDAGVLLERLVTRHLDIVDEYASAFI